MRDDVLKIISSAKDVTNAVILTHNIDFVYVQTVVLAAFRRCGHPRITIFADSACAGGNLRSPRTCADGPRSAIPSGSRRDEPPLPVPPESQCCYPETRRRRLLVGSGNLTFGGWRENAEVWTRFETGADGAKPFIEFRSYLEEILGRVALPDAVEAEIEEAFDPRNKLWVSTETTDTKALIGRVGSGSALIERMLDVGGGDPVDELVICAPYFDHDGIALQQLVSTVGANGTTVLCQPGRSTLQAARLEAGRS